MLKLMMGVAAAAFPTLACANNCGPYEMIAARLGAQHEEVIGATGTHRDGMQIQYRTEFWISEATGSFTVVAVAHTGIACLLLTGHDYTPVTVEAAPAGDPT